MARWHCMNVLRTSQQKSTQVQAVQPKNSQRKSKQSGTRQSENSRIKAGIDIVRKSVVQIKQTCGNYNLRTFECLSAIEVPLYLMYVESMGGTSKQDIQIAIDGFYQ